MLSLLSAPSASMRQSTWVMFMGPEGISMHSGKVQAVQQWPTPQTPKDVRSFLGLAGYYRQIHQELCWHGIPT